MGAGRPRAAPGPRGRTAYRTETPPKCPCRHAYLHRYESRVPRPGPSRARTPFHRVLDPRSSVARPVIRPCGVGVPGGPERVYQDRTLTCRDCAEEFTFSAGEQAFYASKSLVNDPQRCPSCRAAAKRARSADGPREFHAAICGACGGQAVVPFAPRNDLLVNCSSCFDKVRAATREAAPAHA